METEILFRSDIMETELRILKLSSKAPAKNKPYNNQSFSYIARIKIVAHAIYTYRIFS